MKNKLFCILICFFALFTINLLGEEKCYAEASTLASKQEEVHDEKLIKELQLKIENMQNELDVLKKNSDISNTTFEKVNNIATFQNYFITLVFTFISISIPFITYITNKRLSDESLKRIETVKKEMIVKIDKDIESVSLAMNQYREDIDKIQEKNYQKERIMLNIEKNQEFKLSSEVDELFDSHNCTNDEKYHYLISISRNLIAKAKYSQAIQFIKKAISINDFKAEAYVNLGNCYNNLGHYEEALVYYQLAISKDKKLLSPYYNKARCLVKMWEDNKESNLIQEAIETIENSIPFNNDLNYANKELSRFKSLAGDNKGALVAINNALMYSTSELFDVELFIKAKLLLELGHENNDDTFKVAALDTIEWALRINKVNTEYIYFKALILLELNKLNESVDIFRSILETEKSKCTSIYYNLACCYSKMNNDNIALSYLELAIMNNFTDRKKIITDPDLVGLHKENAIYNLIEKYGL